LVACFCYAYDCDATIIISDILVWGWNCLWQGMSAQSGLWQFLTGMVFNVESKEKNTNVTNVQRLLPRVLGQHEECKSPCGLWLNLALAAGIRTYSVLPKIVKWSAGIWSRTWCAPQFQKEQIKRVTFLHALPGDSKLPWAP
jgi:hypothetical protein